ncbi:hypothetical protein MAR_029054 [Mya arenaria]|uniref:Uncharacterized protein n=1 Tax=Mya arenaria TaxID=6604 RepID=A0ABY7DIP6_MYAAR|nr:hypothetical protein MAR_029054 [Mya arenaria]
MPTEVTTDTAVGNPEQPLGLGLSGDKQSGPFRTYECDFNDCQDNNGREIEWRESHGHWSSAVQTKMRRDPPMAEVDLWDDCSMQS